MQGCARGLGKAAGGNRGRCWDEWKGPEPKRLSPSRTSLIFFQKGKEDDFPEVILQPLLCGCFLGSVIKREHLKAMG